MFPNSFAIVGNSASEVGKQKGSIIDGFEEVARFNDFELSESYSIDYGSKTTFLVSHLGPNLKRIRTLEWYGSFKKVFCPVPMLNPDWEGKYWCNQGMVKQIPNLVLVPGEIFRELWNHINWPSTGLSFLWWVYRDRGWLTPEEIFGFSFFDPQIPHHYFPGKAEAKHKGPLERALFEKMVAKEI